MGCVSSRRDINDIHPNIFQVMNVDELLQHVSPGQLEVTESEIVLYQRGNAATRWPLRSLRRYGFDEEIFTFESGRRCPTGPGIYAFRCRRAEQLFNLLQQNIQLRNLSDDLVTVANELSIPAVSTGPPVSSRQPFEQQTYLNSVNTISRAVLPRTQNQNNRFSRPGSVTSNGPASPPSASSPTPFTSDAGAVSEHNNNKRIQHSYSNTLPLLEGDSEASSTVQSYMNLEPTSPTLSSSSEPYAQLNMDVEAECCHVYMNVKPGQTGEASNSTLPTTTKTKIAMQDIDHSKSTSIDYDDEKEDPKHCYANLNPGEPETYQINLLQEQRLHSGNVSSSVVPTISTATTSLSSSSTVTTTAAMMMMEARKVNYIVLDLESKKDLKQAACTSNIGTEFSKKTAKGYATIDFNKTVALSHSVNPCLDLDNEGSRKTRHNSTIGDIAPMLARHSTSLSD